jgi:peptide/nickel transport system substrate-binding protein
MNIILQPEPATLVLALNITSQNQLVAQKMYLGLPTYGFDLTPLPNLATCWDISPDGLTYTSPREECEVARRRAVHPR